MITETDGAVLRITSTSTWCDTSSHLPAPRGGKVRVSRPGLVQRATQVVVPIEGVFLRLVVAAGVRRVERGDDLRRRHRVVRRTRSRAQQGGDGVASEGLEATATGREHLEKRFTREGVGEIQVEQLTRRISRRVRVEVLVLLPVARRAALETRCRRRGGRRRRRRCGRRR